MTRRLASGAASGAADRVLQEFEARLDARFSSVERQIAGVAADVDSVARQTAFLLARAGVRVEGSEDDGEPIQQVDQTWQCRKCGARLGFYCQETDTLRIRHKDLVVYVQVGIGGSVSVPCRSCAEMNHVSNDEADPEQV